MAKVKLRIKFEGKTRNEVVTLKGETPTTIIASAKTYMEGLNKGLSYYDGHVLLAVTPITALSSGGTGLPR